MLFLEKEKQSPVFVLPQIGISRLIGCTVTFRECSQVWNPLVTLETRHFLNQID